MSDEQLIRELRADVQYHSDAADRAYEEARRCRGMKRAQTVLGLLSTLAILAMAVSLTVIAWKHPAVFHGQRLDVVTVPCPSEDSCSVDYYDGAWYIGPPGSRS